MGLDQYLYARKHFSGYDFYGEDAVAEFAKVKEAAGMSAVKSDGRIGVGLTGDVQLCVAYWRKANAIHGWIVRNFAGGVDDCRQLYVPREGLASLLETCNKLLATKDAKEATEVLPPTPGFFFGSDEIDEGYWHDLSHTVSQLNSVLNEWFSASSEGPARLSGGVDFYYQASW